MPRGPRVHCQLVCKIVVAQASQVSSPLIKVGRRPRHRMKVLALTPNLYGLSPGQRSSIELWEKVLEPAGIVMHHSPFETEGLRRVIYGKGRAGAKAREMARAYGRRLRSLGSIDDYDAVLVYREAAMIGPAWIERLVARRGQAPIFQLGAPPFLPHSHPV